MAQLRFWCNLKGGESQTSQEVQWEGWNARLRPVCNVLLWVGYINWQKVALCWSLICSFIWWRHHGCKGQCYDLLPTRIWREGGAFQPLSMLVSKSGVNGKTCWLCWSLPDSLQRLQPLMFSLNLRRTHLWLCSPCLQIFWSVGFALPFSTESILGCSWQQGALWSPRQLQFLRSRCSHMFSFLCLLSTFLVLLGSSLFSCEEKYS